MGNQHQISSSLPLVSYTPIRQIAWELRMPTQASKPSKQQVCKRSPLAQKSASTRPIKCYQRWLTSACKIYETRRPSGRLPLSDHFDLTYLSLSSKKDIVVDIWHVNEDTLPSNLK